MSVESAIWIIYFCLGQNPRPFLAGRPQNLTLISRSHRIYSRCSLCTFLCLILACGAGLWSLGQVCRPTGLPRGCISRRVHLYNSTILSSISSECLGAFNKVPQGSLRPKSAMSMSKCSSTGSSDCARATLSIYCSASTSQVYPSVGYCAVAGPPL